MDGDRSTILPNTNSSTSPVYSQLIEIHDVNTEHAVEQWNNMVKTAFSGAILVAGLAGVKVDPKAYESGTEFWNGKFQKIIFLKKKKAKEE